MDSEVKKYRNIKIFLVLYFILDRFRLFNRCSALAINGVISDSSGNTGCTLMTTHYILTRVFEIEQICDFAFKSKLLIRNTNLEK